MFDQDLISVWIIQIAQGWRQWTCSHGRRGCCCMMLYVSDGRHEKGTYNHIYIYIHDMILILVNGFLHVVQDKISINHKLCRYCIIRCPTFWWWAWTGYSLQTWHNLGVPICKKQETTSTRETDFTTSSPSSPTKLIDTRVNLQVRRWWIWLIGLLKYYQKKSILKPDSARFSTCIFWRYLPTASSGDIPSLVI